MNRMLVTALFLLVSAQLTAADSTLVDHYATLAFRESPYAPHHGIHRVSAELATQRNHYRFEYAADGRIQSIRFQLGDRLRAPNHTSNYFWYDSAEHYRYEGDEQIVSYRDRHDQPTAVHGEVFQSHYRLDASGRRVALSYADALGNPIESAWGIARYQWQHRDDGSVVEARFNLNDEPMHLRPGFAFDRIRLSYGANGLTQLMQYVDKAGQVIAGENGFAQDRFTYTAEGELARYDVLDAKGERSASNMQGIASGLLSFTNCGYEHVASYTDAADQPAYNDNGWWQSERRYDHYGNMTLNAFADQQGNRVVNPNTGYAELRLDWHEDGLRRRERAYFDADGAPVEHKRRGMHALRYRYDGRLRPQLIYLVDRDGQLVEHAEQGWALTRYHYEDDGNVGQRERVSLQQALDEELQHVLDELREVSGVPGMAAAIAERGELIWHGESGFADLERHSPVAQQTRFRLASVSKIITSILSTQAIANGQLTLDSSAAELLDLPHPATLAQLLAHTGSVDHYSALISVDLERDYLDSNAALETVRPHLLSQPTGQEYRYSTFGYSIIGAMLEAASGRTFNQLLAALAEREGLDSIGPGIAGDALQTQFYALDGNRVSRARSRNFSYAVPGAGIVASASDLALLVNRFADGKIVAAEHRERMLQVQQLNDGSEVSDQRYRVALGWREEADASGHVYFHHGGVTDGARAVVMFDSESGRSVALLSNARWTSDVYATALTMLRTAASPQTFAWQDKALVHDDQQIEFGPASCDAWRCSRVSTSSGAFGDWLGKSGGAEDVRLEIGLFGARIFDAYGAAPFVETEAGELVANQGSKRLALRSMPAAAHR